MHKYYILLTILLFTLLSCQSDKKPTPSNTDKIEILVTTNIIEDMVKNIVGDLANVTALMGPGIDPHLYRPTQSDISALSKADVIIYNGLLLEGKMEDILEKLSRTKAVRAVSIDLAKANLLDPAEDAPSNEIHDPHVWFDTNLWAKASISTGKYLGEQDSKNADRYLKNAQAFADKIKEREAWAKEQINSIPKNGRVLITSHDAFRYLGNQFDIEVRGLQGISTSTEVGLRDVNDLVDFIVKRKIKAVFVESSVNEKSLKAVVNGAKKKGQDVKIGGTLYSDALGDANTKEGTYIGMFNHNISTIVNGLK